MVRWKTKTLKPEAPEKFDQSEPVVAETGAPTTMAPMSSNAAVLNDPEGVLELIELFFFAYRDFVGDADRLLSSYGFGRAHHRVIHFVQRRPGLSIAALLDILKITKQSLNRVLKQLLDKGLVEAREGSIDRRQRLLFLTKKGSDLALELAALQSARFERVLGNMPVKARDSTAEFLFSMIDHDQRGQVRQHIKDARSYKNESAA